jgi:hypothetical protein
MKKIIYFKKLFSVGTCVLMSSFISAQENCWHWDYTDEAGVVATLNGAANEDIKQLYDNIDGTTYTLQVGDYVEFELPYATSFIGMLIYSGSATPISAANFEVRGKKAGGNWETNKTKTYQSGKDKGNGQIYGLANFSAANVSTVAYQTVKLECLNEPITISEFQLFGFPGIATDSRAYPKDLINNDAGVVITGSAAAGTAVLAQMTDGGRTTRYDAASNTVWVEVAFSEPKTVKSYLVCGLSANDNDRPLKNWALRGSNTEGDEKEWVKIDTVADFIGPYVNFADMKFSVAEPGSYKYYRLNGTNRNPVVAQTTISELQFYDTDIYVPENITVGKKEIKLNDIAVKTAKNTLLINSASDTDLSFTIYALTGNKVKSGRFTSSAEIFLQNGVYILKIINSNGMEYKTKIIVL